MSKGDKPVKNNSKKTSQEITIKEHLNAEKMLIERLKKQKEVNKEFLVQIESFIGYAKKQAKHNDNDKLEIKYEEIIQEEESLRSKIKEHLKKNDELIKSLQKPNSDV